MVEVDAGFPGRCAWLCQFPPAAATKGRPLMDRLGGWLESAGHLQIDTISVVERAHHHVLWSRDHRYRPELLAELEGGERRLFEYWAHAAAYLPMAAYRYCLPRMRRIAKSGHEWFPTDASVVAQVRQRIRDEGPLRSQDFSSDGKRGPWWDWKPAKAALEFLFMSGELMVAARHGFQKQYDLTERVLPPTANTSYPSQAEMAAWYVDAAASALGCFRRRDLAYQRKDCLDGIAAELAERLTDGRLLSVRVAGRDETDWCVSPAALERAMAHRPERRMRLLSPFDNLIIDRRRAESVFGLSYTLECYVPAAKRRFGYFSLPLFYSGRPVGSIDCKADRRRSVLLLRGCGRLVPTAGSRGSAGGGSGMQACGYGELRSSLSEAAALALDAELADFARFNGCETVSCSS